MRSIVGPARATDSKPSGAEPRRPRKLRRRMTCTLRKLLPSTYRHHQGSGQTGDEFGPVRNPTTYRLLARADRAPVASSPLRVGDRSGRAPVDPIPGDTTLRSICNFDVRIGGAWRCLRRVPLASSAHGPCTSRRSERPYDAAELAGT